MVLARADGGHVMRLGNGRAEGKETPWTGALRPPCVTPFTLLQCAFAGDSFEGRPPRYARALTRANV